MTRAARPPEAVAGCLALSLLAVIATGELTVAGPTFKRADEFVIVLALVVGLRAAAAPLRLPDVSPARVAIAGALVYALVMGFIVVTRHVALRTHALDLAYYVQLVWSIGAGTGANLPLYGPNVAALTLTEPEAPMARKLAKHLRDGSRSAELVEAGAEALPLPDGQFDTVVSTLVLCTVGNPQRALREVWRVLKPGGQLLFIEHVRSEFLENRRDERLTNADRSC